MKKKILVILVGVFMLMGLTGCGKEEQYCCNSGDTLDENGKCLRKEIMTTDVVYTCPNGYIAKTDGVCYRSDGSRAMFATEKISCPNGGTVINNKCTKYYTYEATKCNKSEENKKDNSKPKVEEKKLEMVNEVETIEESKN